MLDYLKELLRDCHLLSAKNGEEGLEVLNENSVDLIITDYMMPKMDGLHFIETVRGSARGRQAAVIVLSALADTDLKVKFLRLGIDDFLQKPFNEQELLARVKNCLQNLDQRNWFLEAQVPESEVINPSDRWLEEVRSFIDRECVSARFSVERIGEQFALSNSTLFRKIKSSTGMNPNGFIREVRLQKARSLVHNQKPESAKELTYSVGLKNTTRFLKQYEERFGEKLSF